MVTEIIYDTPVTNIPAYYINDCWFLFFFLFELNVKYTFCCV